MTVDARKLQKVGGGTFTVSVPKEWAEAHEVEAGTTVNVYTHGDGSLVVRSARQEEDPLAAARFELADPGPAVARRALRAGYRAGFEEVTVATADEFDAECRRAFADEAQTVVGMEVVTETERELAARCLLDASEVSFRQSVTQLEFVALSMHRAATDALTGGDPVVERLRERESEAARLRDLVTRHVNRSLTSFAELDELGVDRDRLFAYDATAAGLEAVARESIRMAAATDGLAGDLPRDVAAELDGVAEDARAIVDEATDAVVEPADTDAAVDLLRRRDDALARVEAVDRALAEREATTAYGAARVVDAVERTARRGGDLAEVALRSAAR